MLAGFGVSSCRAQTDTESDQHSNLPIPPRFDDRAIDWKPINGFQQDLPPLRHDEITDVTRIFSDENRPVVYSPSSVSSSGAESPSQFPLYDQNVRLASLNWPSVSANDSDKENGANPAENGESPRSFESLQEIEESLQREREKLQESTQDDEESRTIAENLERAENWLQEAKKYAEQIQRFESEIASAPDETSRA